MVHSSTVDSAAHEQRKAPRSGLWSLSFAIVTCVLVVVALALGAVGWWIAERFEERSRLALERAVEVRGRGVAVALIRELDQSWRELQVLAEMLSRPGSDQAIGNILDLRTASGDWVAWTGYAQLDGTVMEASDNLLVGESVAQRPWFSEGLQRPFAGPPHEAKLLASRLPAPASGEPLRFLDLASPVLDDSRRPKGVLGIHIDVAAVEALLKEMASALSLDAFLVLSDGAIAISSVDVPFDRLDTASVRAAQVGETRAFVETWPDGGRYMTVVLSQIRHHDMPSFGWSLVVRIDEDAFAVDARELYREYGILLVVVLAGAVALAGMFALLVTRPINRLAASAAAIVDGADVYPSQSRSTAEAATLSDALARIQTELSSRRDGGGPA